jgi:glucosamine 6-phosphate synthetase-like amidotransferase/phosphosugar isomerase protein
MCSIVGMAFQRGNRIQSADVIRDIMTNLLVEGQTRGRRATGVCFVDYHQFTVVKKDVSADVLVNLPEYRNALREHIYFAEDARGKPRLSAVLGHNRWPTCGSEKNQANNHPITHCKVVGTHNGTIGNHREIFERFENAFSRIGEVDSEAIFALVNHFSNAEKFDDANVTSAIVKASRYLEGGYACALSHLSHPYALFLFRHRYPCEVLHFKELGLIIWASSLNFIRSAIQKYDLGNYEEITIEDDSGVGIDLEYNRINRFKLEPTGHTFYT